MTDTTPSAEQLARLARLRERSTGPARNDAQKPKRRRRRHVAQGSRIAAAGLGAGTMLGIVTLLGLDNPFTTADAPAIAGSSIGGASPTPAPVAAPPVQVVIHRIPAASVPAPSMPAPSTPAVDSVAAQPVATLPAAAPIELTANPVVQTITVAAPPSRSTQQSAPSAPAATTKGSG